MPGARHSIVKASAAPLAIPAPRMGPAAILQTIWESYSHHTRLAYRKDFDQLLTYLCKRPVGALDETQLQALLKKVKGEHVYLWRKSLEKAGLTANTISRKLSAVRSVFAACIEAGLLRRNPAIGRRFVVKSAKRLNMARTPTDEQYLALGKHLASRATTFMGKRNMAIFALVAYAAARSGDVVKMTMEGWNRGHQAQDGERVVILLRKGGMEKPLTVPPAAVKWIERYLATRQPAPTTGALIVSAKGEALDRRAVYYMIARAAKRCGFDTHPHAFRHYFATRALDEGESQEQVAAQLGHASLAMIRIYDDHIRAAKAWKKLSHLSEVPPDDDDDDSQHRPGTRPGATS